MAAGMCRYGIIEAISHLIHRDYSSIGDDFKRLDFIPQHIDVTPIVPALTKVWWCVETSCCLCCAARWICCRHNLGPLFMSPNFIIHALCA